MADMVETMAYAYRDDTDIPWQDRKSTRLNSSH